MLSKFLKKDKRGGYISSSQQKKAVEYSHHGEWPPFFKFVGICLGLLKKKWLSWNGAFNAFIVLVLWFVFIKKRCAFHLLWVVYKRLERLERVGLKA